MPSAKDHDTIIGGAFTAPATLLRSGRAILLTGTVLLVANSANALSFTQNAAYQTTSIKGLNTDRTCERRLMTGRVVKRRFAADGLSLRDFIVEGPDGSRDVIDVNTDGITGVQADNVANGLQRLTKVGRLVHGYKALCGVSGSVQELDDIR